MSITAKRKRCHYCGELFNSDPRVKGQQIACSKTSCRKERKKESQQKWFKENPDYFKGRYANTKQWLKTHPDYLKTYRKTHPEYVYKNRLRQRKRREIYKSTKTAGVDIQDTIISQPLIIQEDNLRFRGVDIQDAILTQLVVPVYVSGKLGCVDIQTDIYKHVLQRYTSSRIFTQAKINDFKRRHIQWTTNLFLRGYYTCEK